MLNGQTLNKIKGNYLEMFDFISFFNLARFRMHGVKTVDVVGHWKKKKKKKNKR